MVGRRSVVGCQCGQAGLTPEVSPKLPLCSTPEVAFYYYYY